MKNWKPINVPDSLRKCLEDSHKWTPERRAKLLIAAGVIKEEDYVKAVKRLRKHS